MSSRSSSRPDPQALTVGRVSGHRGRHGELTVRVFGGDASLWKDVRRVWLGDVGHEVERSRTYRDRWVLKLRGVDDANAAARHRGAEVVVASEDAPALPDGVHHADRLIGLAVHDRQGRRLGRVAGVVPTGGADLLRVNGEPDGEELLIPFAREHVLSVDESAGRIEVSLPEGLEELNRTGR